MYQLSRYYRYRSRWTHRRKDYQPQCLTWPRDNKCCPVVGYWNGTGLVPTVGVANICLSFLYNPTFVMIPITTSSCFNLSH